MKRLFAFLLLSLTFQGFAQDYKRTYNWYFGDSAGVDFNTVSPTVLTNGQMHDDEGCATISDTSGNLLFYTNGETVWNKNHQVMDNGTGLQGYFSATQEVIIVPQPGNDSIFYIFTISLFRYSIINIKVNGGLGKVIQKNTLVSPMGVTEKLCATKHQNGKDVWILVHGFENSRDFYAYLLTADGFKACPVITTIGSLHTTLSAAQGDMKFSQSGKKLAVCIYDMSQQWIDLFDFNSMTGTLSNYLKVPNIMLSYSVEFSPNEKLIYATNRINKIYQYDISSGNSTTIGATQKELYWSGNNSFNYHRAIQRASNGKIYITMIDSNFLSTIEYPDSAGLSCGFNLHGLSLGSPNGEYGLPNFVSSYFYKDTVLNYTYEFLCPSQQATFKAKNYTNTPQWQITKLSGAGSWSYNGSVINHTFDTGYFAVKLLSGSDSIIKNIRVGSNIPLVKTDTIACQKDSIMLATSSPFTCIKWNDTILSDILYAKASNTYKVEVWNDQGCRLTDSIKVTMYPTPPDPLIATMPDTIRFCKGTSITLQPDSGNSFIWQDGFTNSKRKIDTTGLFYTSFIDTNYCQRSDTTRLILYPIAPLQKPLPDTVKFCKGTWINLSPDSGANFHWQDGYPLASRSIDTTGLFYTSWADSFSCPRGDTTQLIFYPVTPLQKPLQDSVTFCIGKIVTLTPDSGAGFHWQDNYPNAKRTIDSAGLFFTSWFDVNGCKMGDSILVKTFVVPKPTIQRIGDSLFASGNFIQWQWWQNGGPNIGATGKSYRMIENSWYQVWGRDTGWCWALSDSIHVTNLSIPRLLSPNEITVFPNPVNGVLHIRLQTAEKLSEVQLFSGTGQLVYCETSTSPSEAEINCSALPKGLYLLSLTVTNKTYYQRIIIQ
ncbi:MAG: T9SS type A sorting domain-containing protein [Bacteroidia bacterium]|nr:T9SS type A sorting domain-containing protein [Bacteroidia bacterium]